ncbi:Major facilitator superfamily domain-containing protein 5, partial [Trichinella britovi]
LSYFDDLIVFAFSEINQRKHCRKVNTSASSASGNYSFTAKQSYCPICPKRYCTKPVIISCENLMCKYKPKHLNEFLCSLCMGYMIEATTVVECMHHFCRSCILLHIEKDAHCPSCGILINKFKLESALKLDHTLQLLIYKLIPTVYKEEILRRARFQVMNESPEEREKDFSNDYIRDLATHICSPYERVMFILEMKRPPRASITHREGVLIQQPPASSFSEFSGSSLKRLYSAPAAVRIKQLRKMIASKFTVHYQQVTLWYADEILIDEYSLVDVFYIFLSAKKQIIHFYYDIIGFEDQIQVMPELTPEKQILAEIIRRLPVDVVAEGITERKLAALHQVDTLNLMLYTILMIMTVLTIWIFKHRRLRGAITADVQLWNTTADVDLPPDFLRLSVPYYDGISKENQSILLRYKFDSNVNVFKEGLLEEKATFDSEIFFNILLPPIIFNAGYSLKKGHFFRNIGSILMYAVCGTSLSVVVVGLVMYGFTSFVRLPFSLSETFLFGAVISATDPITVLAIFNDLKVDSDLFALVFGESALNDAVAIFFEVLTFLSENFIFTYIGVSLFTSQAHLFNIWFILGAFGMLSPHSHNRWDKSLLPQKWYDFDNKFLKPLLTHAKPSLVETMPRWCLPIAKLFTTDLQYQQMHCIEPGLYIGAVNEAVDIRRLQDYFISRVLTVDMFPPEIRYQSITYLFVIAKDLPEWNLMDDFDRCIEFIESAIRSKENILVHCQEGISRSATVVAAYLMKNPNMGFMKQLNLFFKFGWQVDRNRPEYKLLALGKWRKLHEGGLTKSTISEIISPDPDEFSPANSTNCPKTLYTCRKCRRCLYTQQSLLEHDKKKPDDDCADIDFILPVKWMAESILQYEGKINCPKCGSKLGSFIWSGSRCGCTAWISPAFMIHRCKRVYAFGHLIVLFADSLQAPYIYYLFATYGYKESDIALLYAVGLFTNLICGLFLNYILQKFERRVVCCVCCVLTSGSCFLKASSDYYVLMWSRIFDGVAATMLLAPFQEWYLHEHLNRYDFPKEWVAITFRYVFVRSIIFSIIAGYVAQFTEKVFETTVFPFLLCVPILSVAIIWIFCKWAPNRQEMRSGNHLWNDLTRAKRILLRRPNALIVCIIQSLYEGSFYLFIFMWTPIFIQLNPDANYSPSFGNIYACFMASTLLGTILYRRLSTHLSISNLLSIATACSLAGMGFSVLVGYPGETSGVKYKILLLTLCLYQTGVGLYFPVMQRQQKDILPAEARPVLLALFRVPLNIIAIGALLFLHSHDYYGNWLLLVLCTALLAVCLLTTFLLTSLSKHSDVDYFVLQLKSDDEPPLLSE